MKILYVVNDLDFFISHRIALANKAVEIGEYQTIVDSKNNNSNQQKQLTIN